MIQDIGGGKMRGKLNLTTSRQAHGGLERQRQRADNGSTGTRWGMQMNSTRCAMWLLAALLGYAAQANAQPAGDTGQRREHKRADLAGAPAMEVISSTAEYKPGERLALHLHHGIETAYVLQGATVQPATGAPFPIATGTTMLTPRGVLHGGFTVVGDTSLKLFTVHVVDKGKPLYDDASAAGQ
jgi:quercetin dioxygenase-like cupin family protein